MSNSNPAIYFCTSVVFVCLWIMQSHCSQMGSGFQSSQILARYTEVSTLISCVNLVETPWRHLWRPVFFTSNIKTLGVKAFIHLLQLSTLISSLTITWLSPIHLFQSSLRNFHMKHVAQQSWLKLQCMGAAALDLFISETHNFSQPRQQQLGSVHWPSRWVRYLTMPSTSCQCFRSWLCVDRLGGQ